MNGNNASFGGTQATTHEVWDTDSWLQGRFREHFQFSALHNNKITLEGIAERVFLGNHPSHELAFLRRAILQDLNQMRFPCVQVHLNLSSAASMFSRAWSIRGKKVSDEVNFHDGEAFQRPEAFGSFDDALIKCKLICVRV